MLGSIGLDRMAISLYLIDSKGAIVREFDSSDSSLDVSGFARGTYQLMIKVDAAFVVEKVVLK